MIDSACEAGVSTVLEFRKKPVKHWFWSVCFECDEEGIHTVQVNDVANTREDRIKVLACLRDFCDRVQEDLDSGS
jgi:hypothetical protein